MPNTITQRPETHKKTLTVTVAELQKLTRAGGIRSYLIVAAGLAWILPGLIMVAFSFPSLRDGENLESSHIVELAIFLASTVMCIAVANYIPKEIGEGTIGASKLMVPQFGALYVGRSLAWLIATVALNIAVAVPVWVSTFAFSFVTRTPFLESVSVQLLLIVLACLIVSTLYGAALVLQRSGIVVFASLMVLAILPVALSLGGMFLPDVVSNALNHVSKGLVGSLIGNVLIQELDTAQSWHSALKYLTGVTAWAATMIGLGWVWFRRPAFGTT